MLEPKEIDINNSRFILHKLNAYDGMALLLQSVAAISSFKEKGEYEKLLQAMVKIMAFVAVEKEGRKIFLINKELIDCHTLSMSTWVRLVLEMIEHNCDFFPAGSIRDLSEKITEALPALSIKMSMGLSALLSEIKKQL